ncbi:MAG: DUF4349 domain-containing protein [Candidatus Margulisiibacteriota bacterium]
MNNKIDRKSIVWIVIIAIVISALLILLVTKRSSSGGNSMFKLGSVNEEKADKYVAIPSRAAPAPSPVNAEGTSNKDEQTANRAETTKIIKTASLTLDVKSVKEAMQKAKQTVEKAHGYVTYASISSPNDYNIYGNATLKVPAKNFDGLVLKLEALGKVKSENINAQDVTEEYMDLNTRLKNLRIQENALRELFKRTGKVSDILEVERELSRVRTQAEIIEGSFRVLKNKISYSTISLSINQIQTAVPESSTSFVDAMQSALRDALTALANLFSSFLSFLIWLVIFVPVVLLCIFVLWIIFFLIRRRFVPKS